MKKTVSLILLCLCLFSLSSCSFWERPDETLKDAVTFEEEDGIKTASYQGLRYVAASSKTGIEKKTSYRSGGESPLVLIGWTEHRLYYSTVSAPTHDRPDFFLGGGKNEIYYREDFDIAKERFALDVSSGSSDEGIALASLRGAKAEITDLSEASLTGVTLHSVSYPEIVMQMYVFKLENVHYMYTEYGTYYAISGAYKNYLIKNHVISEQNFI